MAGKAKFDQEAAFKSIIRSDHEMEEEAVQQQEIPAKTKKNRVQRSYFLDRDVDKALRRKSLEEEKNLTESINEVLRKGLEKYI